MKFRVVREMKAPGENKWQLQSPSLPEEKVHPSTSVMIVCVNI